MKISQIKEVVTINHETGQVVTEEKSMTYSLSNEPSFVKTYTTDIIDLHSLSHSCIFVVLLITEIMDFKSNKAVIVKSTREEFAERLSCSIKLIEKCISELVENNVLYRVSRSNYIVNPKYFSKSSWGDMKKIKV